MSARTWERGECRIVTTDAPIDGEPVLAWFSAEAPGLAVTRVPDHESSGFCAITHVASGRSVSKGFMTLTQAKEAALRLAPLADWMRPRNELFSEPGLGKRVKKALAKVAP